MFSTLLVGLLIAFERPHTVDHMDVDTPPSMVGLLPAPPACPLDDHRMDAWLDAYVVARRIDGRNELILLAEPLGLQRTLAELRRRNSPDLDELNRALEFVKAAHAKHEL